MPRTKTISDEDLLAACRAEFLAQGLQVSTKRIARRAGISEGILFQRFGTKDELFFASMRMPPPHLEAVVAEALGATHVAQALLILARAALDYLRRNMPAVLLVLAHPDYRTRSAPLSHRSHDFLLDAQSMHGGFNQIFEHYKGTDEVSQNDHDQLVGVLISTLLARAIHEEIGVSRAADSEPWLSRTIGALAKGYAGR
jgi:AcrR family transcriptional regulator